MGDAQMGSESPDLGEVKEVSTASRSRWVTKSPGLGEAQMGPHSPGTGEAQVVTRVPGSGRGPGKDQIHQVQEAHMGTESPGMGEAQVASH